jgi:hypothetical protein
VKRNIQATEIYYILRCVIANKNVFNINPSCRQQWENKHSLAFTFFCISLCSEFRTEDFGLVISRLNYERTVRSIENSQSEDWLTSVQWVLAFSVDLHQIPRDFKPVMFLTPTCRLVTVNHRRRSKMDKLNWQNCQESQPLPRDLAHDLKRSLSATGIISQWQSE